MPFVATTIGAERGIDVPADRSIERRTCEGVASEPHLVTVAGENVREGRTPRPGSDDRATHQAALSFFTNLCSSPRRNRPIFARCVQKTNAAMMTLAMKTGDCGSR